MSNPPLRLQTTQVKQRDLLVIAVCLLNLWASEVALFLPAMGMLVFIQIYSGKEE